MRIKMLTSEKVVLLERLILLTVTEKNVLRVVTVIGLFSQGLRGLVYK